ncbi:fam-c protein [Plasmodium chabaudi adami]|uniref:Fam-c protein n=1 Tax=Plasmodium chabaudi adami TaxID=5826 RepID=A0A1C6WG34_PLACE|nr:fam-c protein [Plasmodium chabaudi adami]
MNKRIFSLVCIVLYALLVVSVHCSEQKISDVGNKKVRGTKEINKRNEKDGIESKCETQLENKKPKDDKYNNNNDYNDFFRITRSTGEAITMLHLKRMYRS